MQVIGLDARLRWKLHSSSTDLTMPDTHTAIDSASGSCFEVVFSTNAVLIAQLQECTRREPNRLQYAIDNHQCQGDASSVVDDFVRHTRLLPSASRQQNLFTKCSIVLTPMLGGSPPQTSFTGILTSSVSSNAFSPYLQRILPC